MDVPEPVDSKNVAKAKSYNSTPASKIKNEPTKRKTCSLNDAVKSLDLALGRLKKSKLVNGECRAASGPMRRVGHSAELLMDTSCPSSNINPGIDSASVMSMNFSHYELMRNLSDTNSNSEGTFSGTTDGQTDMTLKDEHLEKYFRSAEMWARRYGSSGKSNTVHFELTDQ